MEFKPNPAAIATARLLAHEPFWSQLASNDPRAWKRLYSTASDWLTTVALGVVRAKQKAYGGELLRLPSDDATLTAQDPGDQQRELDNQQWRARDRDYCSQRFVLPHFVSSAGQSSFRRKVIEQQFRPEHPERYLYTSVVNRVRKLFEQEARRQGLKSPVDQLSLDHDTLKDTLSTTDDDVVLRREEARLVREAIYFLPSAQRRAIWLQYFKDHSYQEIAERRGVGLETIKTQLKQAREKLQLCLLDKIC